MTRPLPRPTELSEPFWAGCREGVLRVQQCTACQQLVFVPRPVCQSCQSAALTWIDTSGSGTVYSYTVVHRPPSPAFEVPYVVAIVELDDGWFLLTNIVDADPAQVAIGAPVEVAFERMDESITLPLFTLA